MTRDNSRQTAGRLRVIAGDLRGRRLRAPKGGLVRPTADRVREALFDILGQRIAGSVFLDAYAGTGAVGIEALSRGAASVTFVEEAADVMALLRGNIGVSGAGAARAQLFGSDLARAIPVIEKSGRIFDLVFLDPPYSGGELDRALRLLSRSRLLGATTTLVAEHESRTPAPVPEGLRATRSVAYGRAALTFFERDGAR